MSSFAQTSLLLQKVLRGFRIVRSQPLNRFICQKIIKKKANTLKLLLYLIQNGTAPAKYSLISHSTKSEPPPGALFNKNGYLPALTNRRFEDVSVKRACRMKT